MKSFKRTPGFVVCTCKKAVYAIVAVVLMGSMFLGTGVTAEAVKLADVFDAQSYADSYPDLLAAFGYNATALLKHYKEYGIAERREVEGILDVVRYREAYPDLDAAFGDNWDAYVNHYFTFGAKERRENFTDFDGLAYAERYQDLKAAYGDDLLELYRHYQAFGKDEGRNAETYDVHEEEEESLARVEVYTSGGFEYVDEYNDAGILFRRTQTSYANRQVFDYNPNTGKILRKYFLSLADGSYYIVDHKYDEEGNYMGYTWTNYDKDGNVTGWEQADAKGNIIASSSKN